MAKEKEKRNQLVMLLILLAILGGAGTWNYKRNLKLETAEPRPFRSYSDDELNALLSEYQRQVEMYTRKFQRAASHDVQVREGGLLDEQVGEFERVQRISQGRRAIAARYAKNQVAVDNIKKEITKRARERDAFKLFLRRLTKYP